MTNDLSSTPESSGEELARQQAKELERKARERQRYCEGMWESLVCQIGERYSSCRLETFRPANDHARDAVARLRAYLEKLESHVRAGEGMLLYGPVGTGKDHLMTAAMHHATMLCCRVAWVNVADLFGQNRDRISNGDTEQAIVDRLTKPTILALSDPLPIRGELTDFQATFLFRVLDARYRHQKPTWATLNVATNDELYRRLGPQNADRLKDGAITLFCNWPSYRKSRSA